VGGLIADVVTHGIIECIVGFNINAMLFFHLFRSTHYGALLLYQGQHLINHPVNRNGTSGAVSNGNPFDYQWDTIVQFVMHSDLHSRKSG